MSKIKDQDVNQDDKYLPMFPEPINGEIASENFLAASKSVLKILDCFDKIFMHVKFDMQKNIDKLTKNFELDKQNYATLQKMIIEEKNKAENSITIDALLWLRRGLHMIQLFFEFIVSDFQSGKGSEDLFACLNKSYVLTLEPYHGYMAQQLFSLLSRMIPTRTKIFRAIANEYHVNQEIIIKCMERFSTRLKENIMILKDFYEEHNLESNDEI